MKIKCPGCSTVLEAPDTAAGKIVKCKCGKQLRLPGGPAAPANPAARPTGAAPAAPRAVAPAVPARPAAPVPGPRPAAAPQAMDHDLFSELTTDDMQPVKTVGAISTIPQYQAPSASSAAALKTYGGHEGGGGGASTQSHAPRPGTLTFLGIVNGVWAGIYFLGVLALFGLGALVAAAGAEGEEGAEGEAVAMFGLVVAGAIVLMLIAVAIAVSCFVRKKVCWYVVLAGYAFYFGDRIMGAVAAFQDEDGARAIGKSVGSIVVGILFWAYLHNAEARNFYGTSDDLKMAVIPDILGLLSGLGLAGAIVFMAA